MFSAEQKAMIMNRLGWLPTAVQVTASDMQSVLFMPEKIPMQEAASSNIKAYGYDKDSATLAVMFQNGQEYRYLNVKEDTFKYLNENDSKGRAINTIKQGHNFVKIPMAA